MALRHLFAGFLLVLLSIAVAFGQRVNLPPRAVKQKYKDVSLELYRAIESGDLQFVRKSLNADSRLATAVIVGPNKGPPLRETLLHYAAWDGHPAVVEELIRRGANVNARKVERYSDNEIWGHDGETPLHKAMWRGNMQTVILLVEHGADVNAATHSGVTPLDDASRMGRTYLVKFLLKHGANINAGSDEGVTALHRAIWAGYRKTADVLAAHGANQDIFCAAGLGNLPLIERLLKEDPARVNARDGDGAAPLHYAAATGQVETAKLLLDRGAAISAHREPIWGEKGQTPLHIAADRGQLALCRLLVERGCPVDVEGGVESPLHEAVGRDHVEIVRFLLEHGADVHRQSALTGHQPLHTAAAYGMFEMAELLLDHGANVNGTFTEADIKVPRYNAPFASGPPSRMTPLNVANDRRQPKMARFLESKGGKSAAAVR